MRDDFNLDERNYTYNGIFLDCGGAMHFYINNIAYWGGMRNMVFPKGYKKMAKYHYLIFENNPQIIIISQNHLADK